MIVLAVDEAMKEDQQRAVRRGSLSDFEQSRANRTTTPSNRYQGFFLFYSNYYY